MDDGFSRRRSRDDQSSSLPDEEEWPGISPGKPTRTTSLKQRPAGAVPMPRPLDPAGAAERAGLPAGAGNVTRAQPV